MPGGRRRRVVFSIAIDRPPQRVRRLSRRTTKFTNTFNTTHPVQPLTQKYSYFHLSEIMLYFVHPVPPRGRFAVVTDVGCGMRWARRVAA
jgi:hypothetical protein